MSNVKTNSRSPTVQQKSVQSVLYLCIFSLLPITHLELVLVHIVPMETEIKVTTKALHEVSSLLSSEVHTTESGQSQYNKMIQLAYYHFSLTSTTVIGIPMKVCT